MNHTTHATIWHLSCSNLTAQFSEQMAIAAIPILAVLALGVSASESAALQAVNTLPFLVLSIPAGLLADRCRRKHLMVVVEWLRAAALLLLFALLFSGQLTRYSLATLGFVIATGTVVYSVAAPALVAALIDKDDLLLANRKLEIARSMAFTIGPSVGGALAGWADGALAFLAALALSLLSVWYLTRLPDETRSPPAERHLVQELTEGIRFVARDHHLRPIVMTSVVYNTAWFLLLGIFAYIAIHKLHFRAATVGAALGVYGLGMVVGAVLHPFLSRHLRLGRQILLGPACAAAAALLVAGTRFAPNDEVAAVFVFVAFFLFGVGPIVWTIATTTLRQLVTPGGLVARVSSVIMTVTFGARPLGAALGAGLSATLGVTSCLVGVVVGFFIQLGIIAASAPARLVSMDELGQNPAA